MDSNSIEELKHKLDSVERRWAMACYVPSINFVICVLASVRAVNSHFCLFHARQGLILFGCFVITIMVGWFFPTLSLMLMGIVLLLHIAGIVVAYRLQQVKIPVIGDFALKIPPYYLFRLLTGKEPEIK